MGKRLLKRSPCLQVDYWDERVPDWRRVFFMLSVAAPLIIFGTVCIDYAFHCYITEVDDPDEMKALRKARGPCPLAESNSGAITIGMFGGTLELLAIIAVAAAYILYRNEPEYNADADDDDAFEKETLNGSIKEPIEDLV